MTNPHEKHWLALEHACKDGLATVGDGPPRYLSCTSGWYSTETVAVFELLDHADPDAVGDDVDLFAVVTSQGILPMGRARNYLSESGDVRREYFEQ